MKFEFGKPRHTAFSPEDVVAVMRARSTKGGNAETTPAPQTVPSYTVAEGSAQSDPVRRRNMLRARIADTEKLIMTAPPGERRDMHVRMLPVYKKQLADLERNTVPPPKTAEFPPEHEMVTPEDLFRVELRSAQAPSPMGTHEVRRTNGRFGPDDVTAVINARYKKDVTPTSKEPVVVPIPQTKPQVAQEPERSEQERVDAFHKEPSKERDPKESTPLPEMQNSAKVSPEKPQKPEDSESTFREKFTIVRGSYSRRGPEFQKGGSIPIPRKESTDNTASSHEKVEIARLREEIQLLNAGFGNREVETARRFGVDTFNRMEASDAIQKLVAEREEEIKKQERNIRHREAIARSKKIREELAVLERAYHGNDAISVARRFGIDTLNQAEARDAIERMVAEREAEIYRLENEYSDTKKPHKEKQSSHKDKEEEKKQSSEKEVSKNKGKENVIKVPDWKLEPMESEATSEQEPQEKEAASDKEPQEQEEEKGATPPDTPKPTAETNQPQPENKPAPETKEKTHTPVDPWVERYLAAQFNIRKEDIEKIEGFGDLTVPQQKSICENLAQLTLGSVQEEATRSVSRAVGMRKSEMVKNYGRFLGGVLSGAREALMGRYNAFTAEKDVAKEMRTGGIQKHGKLLTELVQNMRAYGPRIHESAQGELVVDLVNIRERARDKSTRDAEWFAMNELNAIAHEFAKTPSDWRGQTLGVDTKNSGGVMRFFKEKVLRTSGVVQEGAYAKREEAYARAKRNLENILQKKGEDTRSIADTLLALDTRVYQMQTLSTNPNAMEELAQIKDKSFFAESAKAFFSGPGAYMALGTVGRTLGGAALGFLGAPVVAGAMGSLRSWNRTAAELRERDRNARVGIKDTKGGSLNVVSAERAEQTVMVNGAPVPNGLTAKLNRLLTSLEHAEGEEKKRLLAQLRARIEYTHDKQRLHRIDYGATEGRVTRQAELAKALAKGLVYLSMEDEAEGADVKQRTEKVQGRLAKNLSRTEKMIIEARMKGRRSDLLKSAGVAASFSIAGALLAQLFNGDSVSGMSPHESATAAGTSPETVAGGAGASPVGVEHAVSSEAAASAHTAAAETAAPSLETPAPYTVQRGDSLWNILSHETALKDLGETRARENAVGNILKILTPAQLQEMGITSGDVRIIHPGDVINMEKVSEVLNQHKDIIESARSRFGYLPIDADPKDIIPH